MKKTFGIIIFISIILIGTFVSAKTNTDMIELQLNVIENEKQEKFDIYILLPEQYVKYAIQYDNVDVKIQNSLADTVLQSDIPSINCDKSFIQQDYQEENKKYLQIKIQENEQGKYIFPILTSYGEMDMKYRIKNASKNYIIHFDNFDVEDGICEIDYYYDSDVIKQPDRKIMPFGIMILFIILIVVILITLVSYRKQRKS